MAVKYNRSPVASVPAINNELQKIQVALEDAVSRTGAAPNQLEATLDANSQRIINLPEPVTNTEPVRKADFDELGNNLRSDVYTAVRDAEDATDDAIAATNSANAAASNANIAADNANTAASNAYQAITDLESDGYAVINQIESDGKSALDALRVVNAGSFEDGATLTARNEVLYYLAEQTYYRWDGALPKTVPPTSTPASTGGIGDGAWVDVGDAALRSELANPDKGALLVRGAVIYVDTIADLQAMPTSELVDGQQVQVKEYHAGTGVGGGEFYWDAASTTEANDVTIFGLGSQGRWVRKNRQTVCVTWAGAVPNAGESVDQTEEFAAAFAASRHVTVPRGTYYLTEIKVPNNLLSLKGDGSTKRSVVLRHMPGATGNFFYVESGRVTNATVSGIHLVGNGEEGEGNGFDLTGFSYCRFESISARLFYGNGVYGYGPSGRQFTNNSFYDLESKTNKGHGLVMQGTAHANTFSGCEFSGNGLDGIHHLGGSGNFYGEITAQGNSQETTGERQIYFNGGTANQVFGYCEPGRFNVEFDVGSVNNSVNVRTSYPLWSSYIDRNLQNHFSTGSSGPEVHLFRNPYLVNYYGREPEWVTREHSTSKIEVIDGMPAFVFDGRQNTYLLNLDVPDSSLKGQWVTVVMDVDASGLESFDDFQIRARTSSTDSTGPGELFSLHSYDVNGNPSERVQLSADVRFREDIDGPHSVRISHGSGFGPGVVKIRSIHVVNGKRRGCSAYTGEPLKSAPNMSATDIANATYGINIMNKHPGRMVYDITNDRLLVSQGSDPSSPWADTAGVVQITPS